MKVSGALVDRYSKCLEVRQILSQARQLRDKVKETHLAGAH